MDVAAGVLAAGVLGTVAMDLGNLLFSRAGVLSKIEVGMIGRMAVGWTRGRRRYRHPSEMEEDEESPTEPGVEAGQKVELFK